MSRAKNSLPPFQRWSPYRDIVLFVGGFIGVFHEAILTTTDRPSLLVVFAAMMGLPAFLKGSGKEDRKSVV